MSEIKCKYCGSETVEEPQDFAKDIDPYDLVYGDCQHKCIKCGAIGYECFGHGIRWENSNGRWRKINAFKTIICSR